jgi:chromosome segregation ATPase
MWTLLRKPKDYGRLLRVISLFLFLLPVSLLAQVVPPPSSGANSELQGISLEKVKQMYLNSESRYQTSQLKLSHYEQALRTTLLEIVSLTADLDQSRKDTKTSKEDLERLKTNLTARMQDLTTLSLQLADTKRELQDTSDKLTSLQKDYQTISQSLQLSQTDLTQRTLELAQLQTDYESLQQKYKESLTKIDAIIAQLADATATVVQLTDDIEGLKKEIINKWWEGAAVGGAVGLGVGVAGTIVIMALLHLIK